MINGNAANSRMQSDPSQHDLRSAVPPRAPSPMGMPILGLTLGLLVCGNLLACGDFERYDPAPSPVADDPAQPGPGGAALFVSVARFETLRTQGATVLDAREPDEFAAGHVPGAANTPWHMFVEGDENGLLLDDDARLRTLMEAAGVRSDTPVVVYGLWNEAWGEEGRILWMLEYLGHRDVVILHGGYQVWLATGAEASMLDDDDRTRGDFTIERRPEVRATASEIEVALQGNEVLILDIREREEYDGATPYGSPRGGHIPRAVHFRWLDVFTGDGALRPASDIRGRFSELGIEDDTLVIAYCTGGIRSGFIYAVMRWLGYDNPRNYDGSWWEWSGRDDLAIE